jgi:site-specific recombinase XerD
MTERHNTTLHAAVREYLLEGRARQFTAPTIDHYRRCLSAFTRWAAEHDAVPLGDVTPSLLRAYLVHLQERGLASNTQHTHARVLRAFLNFCTREGLIPESPFAKVKMPKAAKLDKPALAPGDVQRLVRACDKPRDLALLLVMLDTGARVSELCNLNVGDVDLDTLAVTIRQGKGRKDRAAYIGARTARAVSRYLGERSDTAAGAPLLLSEAPHNVDGRLSRSGVRRILEQLGKAAGVHGVHPHKLRRTFAVTCLRAGMDVYTLARLMGHSDIGTLRAYVASIGDALQQAHGNVSPVDRMLKR